jgi:uncharacterized protein (DUF885 family)
MGSHSQVSRISRRDFVKLALTSGETLLLWPILASCDHAQLTTPTLSPSETLTIEPSKTAIVPTLTPSSTATITPTEASIPLTAGLENLEIDGFLDESVKRLFLRDPEAITINGMATLLGVRNDKLTNVSDAYIRETHSLQAGILDLLKKYKMTSFAQNQALNAKLYEWYLDDLVQGFPFMYNDYLVTPFLNSLNWNLQYLFTEAQPLSDAQAAQDYITRLLQVNTKFEQVLEDLNRRKDFGVILPSIIIPDLITDLSQYTSIVESHPYYIAFSTKTSKIPGLSSADRQALLNQARTAIKDNVIPAYKTLSEYYQKLEPAAPINVGVWRYSNGEDYYAYLLRHYTSTTLSAEEIHQMGLENVERIQGEMREEFGMLGYPSADSLGSLMDDLGSNNGYVSGNQAVEAYQAAIDQATGLLDQAFDLKMKDKIAVIGGKEGNYYMPAPRDGSRPATFKAVTDYDQPIYQIKDIAFHEAVPGHGYQFDVARQLNLPLFREAMQYDGYVEGWALYAERLMWELGVYKNDPAGNLGRLSLELLRAVRCVIDTGIHAKRWSFTKAIQYMSEATGYPGEGETRRYIMWPAQATSYYVGFLRILELRQKAKEKLRSRFNLKGFHNVVLGSGQLPLEMLEQQVNAYIAA